MSYAIQSSPNPSQGIQSESNTDLTCNECGVRLARKFDLSRHMLTHSKDIEEFKYTCPFEGCNTACLQKGNLITHMKRHTGVRDVKCPHDGCAWSTCDPAALTRHRKAKHGYIPAPRALRGKLAEGEKKTRRPKPYSRVAPAAELKTSFKAYGGIILPNFLVASMSSSSSTSPPSGCTTSPSPVSVPSFSRPLDNQSISKSDLQRPSSDASADFFKLFPTSVDDASLYQSTTQLNTPFLLRSSSAPTPSGALDTDFSELMNSFGMDSFTASLQESVPSIPATTSLVNIIPAPPTTASSDFSSTNAWQAPESNWAHIFSPASPTNSVFSRPLTPEEQVPTCGTAFSAIDTYDVELSSLDMSFSFL